VRSTARLITVAATPWLPRRGRRGGEDLRRQNGPAFLLGPEQLNEREELDPGLSTVWTAQAHFMDPVVTMIAIGPQAVPPKQRKMPIELAQNQAVRFAEDAHGLRRVGTLGPAANARISGPPALSGPNAGPGPVTVWSGPTSRTGLCGPF